MEGSSGVGEGFDLKVGRGEKGLQLGSVEVGYCSVYVEVVEVHLFEQEVKFIDWRARLRVSPSY